MLQAFQPSCAPPIFLFILWRPSREILGEPGCPGCSIPSLRLGPGLHSRGTRAVGRAVVGTAGALPAHHQDASAPGEGWEVSQKLESLKPCEIPHYGYTFAEFRV